MEPTFESFVIEPQNSEAVSLAKMVCAGKLSRLHIVGPQGSGKSHLLAAIYTAVPLSIRYGASTFMDNVVTDVRYDRLSSSRTLLREAAVLLIDDIHLLTERERAQAELANLNEWRALPVVITSERIEDLAKLDRRLAYPLSHFVTVGIQPVSEGMTRSVVERVAERLGMELSEHELAVISASGVRDLGVLTATLTRLSLASDRRVLHGALEEARRIADTLRKT